MFEFELGFDVMRSHLRTYSYRNADYAPNKAIFDIVCTGFISTMNLSIVLTNLWASLENIEENLVSSTEEALL